MLTTFKIRSFQLIYYMRNVEKCFDHLSLEQLYGQGPEDCKN